MSAINLQTVFAELLQRSHSPEAVKPLWEELEMHYAGKERAYHNLNHLEALYEQLLPLKELISDWDCLLFALFYHDVIYDVLKNDNEEQSALLARERLTELSFPKDRTERCYRHIIATKQHGLSTDPDTNYFTDADLSILGSSERIYLDYAAAIRKEYAVYPDELYVPGRIKALEHFLEQGAIFKTPFFAANYEKAAVRNVMLELDLLRSNKFPS